MPPDYFPKKAKQHVAEAWRNYCLYDKWVDKEPSWALVLLFYSALHLVQAHAENQYAKKPNISLPSKHLERTQYIAGNLQKIIIDYRELQTASEDVRYDMVRYSLSGVLNFYTGPFSRIAEDLRKKAFPGSYS